MDKVSLQKIQEIVSKNASFAIVVGKDPSLDQMASALSLYLAFSAEGKKVAVACPSDPIVEISSLVGIDKVTNRLEGENGDLIVAFPYREGEIEKVSYTIENNFLNIVVKAGNRGLTFNEQDVKYTLGGGGTVEVMFVIGTAKLSDLGPIFNPETLKDTTIVNIDNKAENQGFGELVIVSPNASSVSEMVAEFIVELGYELDVDISQNLLSGILEATENFQNPQTSSLALEMAGLLMKNGAVRMPSRPTLAQNDKPALSQFMPHQSPRIQQPFMQQRQSKLVDNRAVKQFSQREQVQVQGSQDTQVQADRPQPAQDRKPPADWLTPKVYKGSSDIDL